MQADHLGRRFLLIEAGIQMLLALLVIAISLARLVPAPLWLGWYILAFILVFDSAYAWSWCARHLPFLSARAACSMQPCSAAGAATFDSCAGARWGGCIHLRSSRWRRGRLEACCSD